MFSFFRGCRSVQPLAEKLCYGYIKENRFLEKIQTKFVWIFKENIYTITFCQMFLTLTIILKSGILTIKIGVPFLYKNLFFFSRLNRFLFFGVFKCQII